MAACAARRSLTVLSRLLRGGLSGSAGVELRQARTALLRPVCGCRFQQDRTLSSRNRPEGKVLETVGVFEVPKQQGKYETGQLFLHSIFGYRGIVLFPWQARLYDRDVSSPVAEKSETSPVHGSKEVKGKTHTYYQVLIDARDCPHISQRSQTEAVTFLANHDDSRALYAIPGLDYVSHEDILPYNSTDQIPIQHELFERFLSYDQTKVPPFEARETLRAWQEKNHPWLELSDVHRETTDSIRVTVIPFYMGMREAQNSHVYWTNICGKATILSSLWGTFRFERPDGSHFDVRIPPFSLESNKDEKTPPSGLHW
ncbi:polymerase delta-interacting protein 2 [Anomaloglossus baeobatrachus]|uniref:polymerase delta-interacting protein 2 n=1 Tax=Anomaloglossus baeobatrachus TaxID=238106 RepID=UPI003F506049